MSPAALAPTPAARAVGFAPVADARARLLILGSFPGAASLRHQQYYAHPRNQFWPILSRLLDRDLVGLAYPDRLQSLRDAGIALWDVVESCVRPGSLDANIGAAQPNSLDELIAGLPLLRAVAFNGAAAANRGAAAVPGHVAVHRLPSTSPAHAALDFDSKLQRWCVLRSVLAPALNPTPEPALESVRGGAREPRIER